MPLWNSYLIDLTEWIKKTFISMSDLNITFKIEKMLKKFKSKCLFS